jgi:lipopolysaccharide export system protein LptA
LQPAIWFAATVGWLTFMAAAPMASMDAESMSQAAILEENQDIHIKADEVIANLETGETQFVGNVRVTQGQSVITADHMTVYYRKSEDNPNNPASREAIKESIQKIIARGNVKINYENMIALSEEAVYMADSQLLTLTGKQAKVTSGPHSLTGSKFILSLASNALTVEGSQGQRVRATVFPGKGDLF